MRRERAEHSDGVYWLPAAHLVLNFRDPAPPSPRGVLAYATPRRLPFRLITRNLSSGMWPSSFSSLSKSALNAASASTIASKDFFTAAGKSSASMFCHFNSSRAIVLLQLGRRKAHARSLLDDSSYPSLFNGRSDQPLGFHVLNELTHVGSSSFSPGQRKIGRQELDEAGNLSGIAKRFSL